MAFNRSNKSSHIIRVPRKDQQHLNPISFIYKDIINTFLAHHHLKYTIKEFVKRLDNISNKSDREKAELIFFLLHLHLYEGIPLLEGNLVTPAQRLKFGFGIRDSFVHIGWYGRYEPEEIWFPELFLDNVKTMNNYEIHLYMDKAIAQFVEEFYDLLAPYYVKPKK